MRRVRFCYVATMFVFIAGVFVATSCSGGNSGHSADSKKNHITADNKGNNDGHKSHNTPGAAGHGEDFVESLYKLIPPVAARVNNIEISGDKVKMAVKIAISQYGMLKDKNGVPQGDALLKDVVGALVREELVYQQRIPLKVTIDESLVEERISKIKSNFPSDDEFKKSLNSQNITEKMLRDDFTRRLTMEKLVKDSVESKVKISDKDIKSFYNSNPDKFKTFDSIKTSHILVKVSPGAEAAVRAKAKARIEKALKKVKGGEKFEDVAKELSDDSSASRGGDLGYVSRGAMVPEFEKAAFSLKAGEVSAVVETPFGFHIIKVFDVKKGTVLPLEESREKIESFLKFRKTQEKLGAWIAELEKSSKIEILL